MFAIIAKVDGVNNTGRAIVQSFLKQQLSQEQVETYVLIFDEYLEAHHQVRSGQLFEEPPGWIFSNFKNIADPNEEVFGLFYCSAQNTYRIFVDHELVGSPHRICPPNVPPSPNPCPVVSCCDCLNATISTTEKPVWWVN